MWIPDDWPEARFDLVVISELAYYLEAQPLADVAAKTVASLLPGGDVVACHWRRPIAGCSLPGDAVPERLSRTPALPRPWSLIDPDFRLEIWSADGRSIGAREGLA